MKRFLRLSIFLLSSIGVNSWAVTLFNSTNAANGYTFLNGTYYSATGEATPTVSTTGSTLFLEFGQGFVAVANGNPGIDLASANIGVSVQSSTNPVILGLNFAASGTFSVNAPNPVGFSYANVDVAIPLNITLTGVNGVAYTSAPPTVGKNLNITFSASTGTGQTNAATPYPNTADSTPVETHAGSWFGSLNIADVAALFSPPSMKITQLSLAITPDLTAYTLGGTATVYMSNFQITPVPEPSSTLLACIGGITLFLLRRFRGS